MAKKLDPSIYKEIGRLYLEEKMTPLQIGKLLDRRRETIQNIMTKNFGYKHVKSSRAGAKKTIDRKAIEDFVGSNTTVIPADIARHMGNKHSIPNICRVLTEMGYERHWIKMI
jgi:hypothetical protein